jgi:hypothetical protein
MAEGVASVAPPRPNRQPAGPSINLTDKIIALQRKNANAPGPARWVVREETTVGQCADISIGPVDAEPRRMSSVEAERDKPTERCMIQVVLPLDQSVETRNQNDEQIRHFSLQQSRSL